MTAASRSVGDADRLVGKIGDIERLAGKQDAPLASNAATE
jgi:hypothetical protein